jgi:splicing factor U2AF subunit
MNRIILIHRLTCPSFQVFLEYADVDGSTKAKVGMHGRKFGGNQVVAVFYPEDKFAAGDYDD